ncbi:MAG: AbrB/MazE/SpoVT family DNA-binding domain-containing protein [Puniceicoccaceae bacterium]
MSEKVKIGKRGVITLPSRLRKKYRLEESDDILVEETPEGLLLRPMVSMPIEIYTEERIAEFLEDEEELGKILDRIKEARKKQDRPAE